MENRIVKYLLICVGIGVVAIILKNRKKVKKGLITAGASIKEGSTSAFQAFKKEKEKEVKITPVQKRKKQTIKLGAFKTGKTSGSKKTESKSVQSSTIIANVSPEMVKNILRILEENKKGVTLTDLGAKLGIHFVRLAQPIKQLLEKGKVRKKGKLYFATA